MAIYPWNTIKWKNKTKLKTELRKVWNEVALHKTTTVWPLTSHLMNHSRRRTRHDHCGYSMKKLTSDVLLKTLIHGVNGQWDRSSILGRVIPKAQKWYLTPPCLTLSIIRYVSREKSSHPGEKSSTFPYTSVL